MTTRVRWLRRDLLLRLMLPLLAIVAITGAIGAYGAEQLTQRVFDRWLLDAARSLAHQVNLASGHPVVDLPVAAEAILAYDETDRTWFSVSQGTRLLAGHPDVSASGTHETVYRNGRAFDAFHNGQAVRVAAVHIGDGDAAVDVRVAETMIKRNDAQQELWWGILPLVALLMGTAVAIDVAVRRTLSPLRAMAASWNERAHASLAPIALNDVPRELLPFAGALNELLDRIRAVLDRERQFAATAAHQLRTPLAGLQLGLARAADAPDLAHARGVLQELDATTQRTARLVQQLLALSRLDPEARGDIGFVQVDLGALAHDVGASMIDAALARGIDLELVAPSTPVQVNARPELLTEALGNLLDNALRYAPSGSQVLIEVLAEPPTVCVIDSGPGVAPDELDQVFDRFVRGRSAQGEGSGLGLAIVREIASLHGADVTMARRDEVGTVVTLTWHRLTCTGDPALPSRTL